MKYLLVYSNKLGTDFNKNPILEDHYNAYDNLESAQKAYEEKMESKQLYSASICTILKSTDY